MWLPFPLVLSFLSHFHKKILSTYLVGELKWLLINGRAKRNKKEKLIKISINDWRKQSSIIIQRKLILLGDKMFCRPYRIRVFNKIFCYQLLSNSTFLGKIPIVPFLHFLGSSSHILLWRPYRSPKRWQWPALLKHTNKWFDDYFDITSQRVVSH